VSRFYGPQCIIIINLLLLPLLLGLTWCGVQTLPRQRYSLKSSYE